MPRTLQDLKDEADSRLAAGNTLDALRIYRLVLEGQPLDFDMRLHIADVLVKLGKGNLAPSIYKAVATHDARSGNPLRAIVALKLLAKGGVDTKILIEMLAKRYASGSEVLGRGIRPAPADYSAEVREDLELDFAMDQKEIVEGTAKMAAYLENIENYPPVVPPVAIFSTLQQEAFAQLLDRLVLKRFEAGEAVISQGETGDEMYFLARGEVDVVKDVTRPDGSRSRVRLARLGLGSLFGEMALVSDEPRGASVIAETGVDVLELKRADIEELAHKLPQVSGAMARFTRERMIANLLATNPLFEPFDDDSKKQLLARFTGHDVPSGTLFLEQGNPGNGLYVILQGKAEVLKWDGGEYIKLADLGPGDAVGEISLIHEEPVSATVRTTAQTTLLFLARELFMPLVEAVPDLLAHFARLAQKRLEDTESKLQASRMLADDFIEELDDDEDEILELSDDDAVMV